MKWFVVWRLRRIRAKIAALEEVTRAQLVGEYTAHSRLRVLRGLEANLARSLNQLEGFSDVDPQAIAEASPPSSGQH